MNSSGITESGESEKVLLLMESGVRLHTTAYLRYPFIYLTSLLLLLDYIGIGIGIGCIHATKVDRWGGFI